MKITIEIEFHGPFRVATGTAAAGVGVSVDRDELLPSSSLKGLMRAEANRLFRCSPDLVGEVFGHPPNAGRRRGSPWNWGPVTFTEQPAIDTRARIAIDPTTHTARPNFLAYADEVWARTAVFTIRQHEPLDDPIRQRHVTVLLAAAAAVHSLGANRRRGLGWVTLRPVDPPLDEQRLAAMDALIDPPAENVIHRQWDGGGAQHA